MLQNIFQFWLDKGIDALSINDIHTLYESDDTGLDEPTTEDETLPVSLFFVQFHARLCCSHLKPNLHETGFFCCKAARN